MSRLLVLDPSVSTRLIRSRREIGIDKYDEVWDGTYMIFPPVTNLQQHIVGQLSFALCRVLERRSGRVYAGANVSDRGCGWEENYRCPDVVVVLRGSRAIDRTSHLQGGPDFLAEVQCPDNGTEEKVPFYSRIGVRELLIIDRDTRHLRLMRHDGSELTQVEPTVFQRRRCLMSQVVPLAFVRHAPRRGVPQTTVLRTDGRNEGWTF
jgi:Uma2 family endonuclease